MSGINKYYKEPTIAEIEENPWRYLIWRLLEYDELARRYEQEVQILRTERNRLAKLRRK